MCALKDAMLQYQQEPSHAICTLALRNLRPTRDVDHHAALRVLWYAYARHDAIMRTSRDFEARQVRLVPPQKSCSGSGTTRSLWRSDDNLGRLNSAGIFLTFLSYWQSACQSTKECCCMCRLEAGQPLPHLATENKALQDMHKQLEGWISDIRERKSGTADFTSPTSTALPSPGVYAIRYLANAPGIMH